MTPIAIGGKPLAGFNQPIEMMMDCHRRIEHFLEVLKKVVERFDGGTLDDDGRRALEKSLDYFAHAAPRHTADEEHSLFPRMRRSDDPAVHAAMAELDRLEADHRRAEAMHGRVEELGRRWLESGRLDLTGCAEFRRLLDDLAAIYEAHIRLEDERVFVLASRVLEIETLHEVGEEMRKRRAAPAG